MPQPSISQVHVNRPLTNFSVAYLQRTGYVAGQVFPFVPSDKQSNTYWEYDRAYFLRSEADYRAPGSRAKRIGHNLTTNTFTCLRDAVARSIPDPVIANADEGIDMKRDAVELCTQQLLIRQEQRFATAFFGTSIWNADTTPGTLWDVVTSTPIEDIEARKLVMIENTGGYRANGFLMGAQAWSDGIKNHPDIIDRIKYTQRGIVTEELFASLIGVDKVLVSYVSRNTGAEGATASYDFVLGQTNALLYYAAPSASRLSVTAGATFTWSGAPDGAGNSFGLGVKNYREPEADESDTVEVNSWYTQRVISTPLGEFFSAVVS